MYVPRCIAGFGARANPASGYVPGSDASVIRLACDVDGCTVTLGLRGPSGFQGLDLPAGWTLIQSWERPAPHAEAYGALVEVGGKKIAVRQAMQNLAKPPPVPVQRYMCPKHRQPKWKEPDEEGSPA